jgi:hypothetical protein
MERVKYVVQDFLIIDDRKLAVGKLHGLLPFNRRRRLGRDIVHHPIHPPHLIDNPITDRRQHIERHSCPIGRHEILAFDRADRDHAVVTPRIAHHADGADRQQHGEDLGGFAVEVGGDDFFQQNLIGISQDTQSLGGDIAQHAHGQAGAGEGVTPDEVFGQTQDFAELAHFVLEEFAQGFDELEAKLLGQSADVVVQFDVRGRAFPGPDDARRRSSTPQL